jgi:ketosteroid isomerase-like protein
VDLSGSGRIGLRAGHDYIVGTSSLRFTKEFAVRRSFLLPLAVALTLPLGGQSPASPSSPESAAIVAMMEQSVADWNRGDLDAFATCYKNSPDILFIGHTISRGYAQMLASYKTGYPTREKMGTLSFSRLETQPLDASFATVTGHFHLERSAAGGGNADGYFLLVVEKTSSGWKIVRDDTTALPPPQSK